MLTTEKKNMNQVLMAEKISILSKYGLPVFQATKLVASAFFLQDEGGSAVESYWTDPNNFTARDEYFLVANTIIPLAQISSTLEGEEWLLTFQTAYLSQVKQTAQSVKALDLLSIANCYADAFGVIRALHSRTNLLLLFSFNPDLFRYWLANPKDPKYLDGHIRRELEKHGLRTMTHSYELASELLHGQIQAHSDVGLFENGIFNNIPAIKNRLYILGKFILGAFAYSIIQATLIGKICKEQNKKEVIEFESMFDNFLDTILSQNKQEHMFTIIAEERHWEKIGKNKYDIGGSFNYLEYKEQLLKFHRNSGQKKHLSKEYG